MRRLPAARSALIRAEQWAHMASHQLGRWHGDWHTFAVVGGRDGELDRPRLVRSSRKAAIVDLHVQGLRKRQLNTAFAPTLSPDDTTALAAAEAAGQCTGTDFGSFGQDEGLRARYAGPSFAWCGAMHDLGDGVRARRVPPRLFVEIGLACGDVRRRILATYIRDEAVAASCGGQLRLTSLMHVRETRGDWPAPGRAAADLSTQGATPFTTPTIWTQPSAGRCVEVRPRTSSAADPFAAIDAKRRAASQPGRARECTLVPAADVRVRLCASARANELLALDVAWREGSDGPGLRARVVVPVPTLLPRAASGSALLPFASLTAMTLTGSAGT
jgi:hypothetical protein